jgi:hypothetical protein
MDIANVKRIGMELIAVKIEFVQMIVQAMVFVQARQKQKQLKKQ